MTAAAAPARAGPRGHNAVAVMADQLDRRAGRAWRAGDLEAAGRLIAAARRLDPSRAVLWDRREALIHGQSGSPGGTRSIPDGSRSREPADRGPAPGRDAGHGVPGGWRALIEAALTRPGALDAGTARQVIAAWLSGLEGPCGRCGHQQAAHTGGGARSGWPVYDRIWVHAAGPCTAGGCPCPHRIPPTPGQAATAAQARAARRQRRYERAREAGGLDDARAGRQIAGWNAAVLARAGAGPPAQEGGPAL